MNRKINVIKINGFKGILLAGFIIGCLIAGFLIFPGWVCKNIWNFAAQYFNALPVMTLLHGTILWVIVALSTYALNKGKFAISFGSGPIPPYKEYYNEARINDILKQISEKNASILPSNKNDDISANDSSDNADKITKE